MRKMVSWMVLAAALLAIQAADARVEPVNTELWNRLRTLNASLEEGNLSESRLESLYVEALDIAFSAEMSTEVRLLRQASLQEDDFSILDSLEDTAQPAINIRFLGESTNIGVSAQAFLLKAQPGTQAYEFFELASDGYYVGEPPFHRLGSGELPVWMHRTESSAQAEADPATAAQWLALWNTLAPGLDAPFAEVAATTIAGLEELVYSEDR